MKFVKNTKFYPQPTYEFNLPAGHTCPFAISCKTKVNRDTGKFECMGEKFICYAAVAERFPSVRKHRWENYDGIMRGEKIVLPKDAKFVRIHGSGDFFSQDYFDMWLKVCRENPDVTFWAFTKSIPFWINRKNYIPENLTLQASAGSTNDDMIVRHNLKYAKVYDSIEDVPDDMLIDIDDALAMYDGPSFALLKVQNGSAADRRELAIEHNNKILGR